MAHTGGDNPYAATCLVETPCVKVGPSSGEEKRVRNFLYLHHVTGDPPTGAGERLASVVATQIFPKACDATQRMNVRLLDRELCLRSHARPLAGRESGSKRSGGRGGVD